jgi:WD40 repeat protein
MLAGDRWGDPGSGIRVWDLTSESVGVLEGSQGMTIWPHTFLGDGSLITGDNEGNLRQWNIEKGTSSLIEKSQLPAIRGLESLSDPHQFVAVFWSSSNPEASTTTELRVFDQANHTSRRITSHGNRVCFFALDSTKTLLMTGSWDGTFRLGPITGEEPHQLIVARAGASSFQFLSPSISPDGRWIAGEVMTSSGSMSTYLWRMPQGRPIHTLPHDEFLAHLKAQTNLRVGPDKAASTGYRIDTAPFPGWENQPPEIQP